ncbi:MAG TPA: hypothetical protein VGR61_10505 [Candidatus Dormibacteraeota bacterium]|nr:hypothetical protein [Candidatus Dormibacteraeota bacterium]
MSLSLQAFAPAALLLAGALALLLRPSATLFVAVQAATLAALLRLSQLSVATLTIPVYDPISDVPLLLRLDRLSLFFATTAVAAALLVALPWVGDRQRQRLPLGWLVVAEFGAVGGILAGTLQGLAAGWGVFVAALLMLVLVPQPVGGKLGRLSGAVTRTLFLYMAGASMVLLAAVAIEAVTGTANYDAVPVGAVDGRSQALLVAAPVLALAALAGLLRACRRPAVAAVMVTAVVLPVSAYTLARTIDLAEGRALPGTVGLLLVLTGGLGATIFGLYAIWAPDLGATVGRLINALALLLVAAFALGGSGALVALLVGFMSLEVVAGATLALVDAGDGRLPGAGPAPRWVLGPLALLPLAAAGGLLLAMSLDARLFLLRRLADLGVGGYLAALPLVAALLAVLAGSIAAGRFGGGRLAGRRGLVQLGLAAGTLVAMELAAPALRDLAVSLAAASARVPPADVRSTSAAAVPGPLLGAFLLAATVGLVAVGGARRDVYDPADGLRQAPDMLPPPIAVTPEILARRAAAGSLRRLSTGLRLATSRPRWAISLAWLGAALVVVFAGR